MAMILSSRQAAGPFRALQLYLAMRVQKSAEITRRLLQCGLFGTTTVVVRGKLYNEVSTHLNQFRESCTMGARNLTVIGTTANRSRSGELAVVPRELGARIFAEKSTRNWFGQTLTEARAPQMTWLWNWSLVGALLHHSA